MSTLDNRPVSALFSDAVTQFSKLVQDEIALARAELSQKASQVANGVGLLIAASVLLIPTIVILLIGLAALLVEAGWRSSTANFVAGGASLAIAIILLLLGRSRLSAEKLTPRRTIRQVEQDAAAVKEHI